MWSFIQNHRYIAVMGFSAALSLSRGLIVAYILLPNEFSLYIAVISTGSFLAYILSFGLVEATIKQFPRLFLDHHYSKMISLTDQLTTKLFLRASVAVFIFIFIFVTDLFEKQLLIIILFSIFIAYANSVVNLVSSLQRSLFHIYHFSLGSLLRASIVFIMVMIGAIGFGVFGAISAEIIAIIAGAWGSKQMALFTLSHIQKKKLQQSEKIEAISEHGKKIFFAFLALSAPFYLDKIFINTYFSETESATYAFSTILITGAAVFVNIIAQKVGPEIIKLKNNNSSPKTQIIYAAKWSLIPIAMWCSIIIMVFIINNSQLKPEIFEKYHVTNELLFSICFLGVFQVSSIFEFLLLANDNEAKFLLLSLFYFVSIIMIASLCVFYGAPIYLLIASMGVIRFFYLMSIALTILINNPST